MTTPTREQVMQWAEDSCFDITRADKYHENDEVLDGSNLWITEKLVAFANLARADLKATIAEQSALVGYFFNDGSNNWFEGEKDNGIPLFAHRLLQPDLIADQAAEIETLRADLETERIRLAACGVVAMANTCDSAITARQMLPEYRSASCDDVARAVDAEMSYRDQLSAEQAKVKMLTYALMTVYKAYFMPPEHETLCMEALAKVKEKP